MDDVFTREEGVDSDDFIVYVGDLTSSLTGGRTTFVVRTL